MIQQSYDRDSINLKTETLMNPKYDMAKQKMKELFLLWLSEDNVNDFLTRAIVDSSLTQSSPNPLQEDIPVVHNALNKSFIAPPVIKKKDTSIILSKTIVNENRTFIDDSRIAKPKMSLLKTTKEESSGEHSTMKLQFILYTNFLGDGYNEKEEAINSMFKTDSTLSILQMKFFVTKVLELPEHFHVYLDDLSMLIRKNET